MVGFIPSSSGLTPRDWVGTQLYVTPTCAVASSEKTPILHPNFLPPLHYLHLSI